MLHTRHLWFVAVLASATGCAETDGSSFDTELHSYESAMQRKTKKHCANPKQAVLDALECFQVEDPQCVANTYRPDFQVLHNDVPNGVDTSDTEFWGLAFFLFDISMDISHFVEVNKDQVSIRYIETLTFIDGDAIDQHEHALATVAPDCTIAVWDQYGDNAEQQAVNDKFTEILSGL